MRKGSRFRLTVSMKHKPASSFSLASDRTATGASCLSCSIVGDDIFIVPANGVLSNTATQDSDYSSKMWLLYKGRALNR
jgi:hypothetical protein